MRNKKLFVGICNSQSQVPSNFFWSIIAMKQPSKLTFARAVHPWDVIRNNELIDWFLKSDCDYFVKMDVDQVYPDNYFEKMLPLVEKYKVIGPLIFDRWPTGNFMPLVNFRGVASGVNKPFDVRGKSGIIEVPYYHTNCFFHRDALEAIPQPHYEAHATPDGLKRSNHVDAGFMEKFPKAGFKIYANLDVCVKHIAEVEVDREVHERWKRGSV